MDHKNVVLVSSSHSQQWRALHTRAKSTRKPLHAITIPNEKRTWMIMQRLIHWLATVNTGIIVATRDRTWKGFAG